MNDNIIRVVAQHAERAQLCWQAPREGYSPFVDNSIMARHQRSVIRRRAYLNGDRRIRDVWLPLSLESAS